MQHREPLDDVSELVRSLPPLRPRPADRLEVHRPDLHHVFFIEHLEWVAAFFARHLVGRHL